MCDVGFAGYGDNNCTQCDPGTYQNRTDQPECLECPSNHFCPRGSEHPAQCPPIPNSGSPPGSSSEGECACNAGFSGPKCDPVVPVAAIALAAVGGVSLAAGSGAYYFSQVAAGKAAAAAQAVLPGMKSQFSSAEIRVDLVIKTHHA